MYQYTSMGKINQYYKQPVAMHREPLDFSQTHFT